MYNSKNSQYTSIHKTNISRRLTIPLLCLLILLLSGCSKAKETQDTMKIDQTTVESTQTVSPTPTLKPTPTPKPSASITIGEELTVADAQAILEERLDNSKYSLDLLSQSMKIDGTSFIAFLACEDAIPLEPILLVNMYNGKISCLSKEGKTIAFSNFPINQQEETIALDWNGTFYMRDKYERVVSTLELIQNDNSSFEFYVQSKDSITSYTLAGIGHIDNANAIFTSEDGKELMFIMAEDSITLYDNQAFTKSGLGISGTYYLSSSENSSGLKITKEQAMELVLGLSMAETKLPANLSDYSLDFSDNFILIHDRICYEIGAYAQFEGHDVLVTSFYVSVDGNVIFEYDTVSKNTYTTIALN